MEQFNILLIGGDDGLASLLIDLLSERFTPVRYAPTSVDGEQALREATFDLVIVGGTAAKRGVPDAPKLIRQIKAQNAARPVLLLTGSATSKDASSLDAVRAAGVDDIIIMPAMLDNILGTVYRYLSQIVAH